MVMIALNDEVDPPRTLIRDQFALQPLLLLGTEIAKTQIER